MSIERERLVALLDALDASERCLERPVCRGWVGDWQITGKHGHAMTDGDAYLLYVTTPERDIDKSDGKRRCYGSPRRWGNVKKGSGIRQARPGVAMVKLAQVHRVELGQRSAFDRPTSREEVSQLLEERVGPAGRKMFEDFLAKVEKLERHGGKRASASNQVGITNLFQRSDQAMGRRGVPASRDMLLARSGVNTSTSNS